MNFALFTTAQLETAAERYALEFKSAADGGYLMSAEASHSLGVKVAAELARRAEATTDLAA